MIFTYTTIIILSGVTLLGFTAGMMGTFAFLRQESLLGDAISHASLPGIALMFLATHTKSPLILLFGGALAGFVGVACLYAGQTYTILKKDALLGIVLSVFFGFGLVLLTVIQKTPIASQSMLNKFLFGNAATLLYSDVKFIAIVCFVIWVSLFFCFKEFALATCDRLFAQSLGYNLKVIDVLLLCLQVITIVIGLQTVGVILMSSMMIAPAASARQWTKKLWCMVLLSGIIGSLNAIIGALISCSYERIPTGPAIVVVASCFVIISLLFGAHRGLIYTYLRKTKNIGNSYD